MGGLSRKLEEKRLQLGRFASRHAFDSYLRYGRVPDAYMRLADAAAGEAKFLDFCASLSLKAFGDIRPTTHYVWRTAGDDRVRGAHAANAGQIFAWAGPPETGHPGTTPNCRCWPEPYYGNPAIPDALLPLRHSRVGRTGSAPWISAERLTRPDGSLAESVVIGDDGTRVHSTFAGTAVNHVLTLPGGRTVGVAKRGGTQRVSVDGSPLFETTLSSSDPRIRVRQFRTLPLPVPLVPPVDIGPFDAPREEIDPLERVLITQPMAAVTLGLLKLFNMISAELPSFGAGTADVPIIAFRAWSNGVRRVAGAVAVTTLTATEANQLCTRLPDVQAVVNAAAAELAPLRSTMSAAKWGTLVHSLAKKMIDARRAAEPEVWGNVFAEISLDLSDVPQGENNTVRYGKEGSTRLDVLEIVNAEVVCVYDAKTGKRGLSASRVAQIAAVVEKFAPGALFVIMELLAGEDLPF